MVESQEAAVTESWELAVALERFGPWVEERADSECLERNQQISSGHVQMVLKYAQMRNPLKGCLVLNMALLVLVQRVWSSPPPNSSTMGLWSGLQGWIHCGIWWPWWSGWSIIRAVGQGKLVVLSRNVQRPLTR